MVGKSSQAAIQVQGVALYCQGEGGVALYCQGEGGVLKKSAKLNSFYVFRRVLPAEVNKN